MEEQLAALIERLGGRLSRLADRRAYDGLSTGDWYSATAQALTEHHIAAYLLGRSTTWPEVRDDEREQLWNVIGQQLSRLEAFADQYDHRYAESPSAFRARVALYAPAVKALYWEGQTYGIPLPAQPGDGTTQCITHCLCRWEITPLKGEGNWDCRWVLGATDKHCQTCVTRSSRWNPLKVRGGMLITQKSINVPYRLSDVVTGKAIWRTIHGHPICIDCGGGGGGKGGGKGKAGGAMQSPGGPLNAPETKKHTQYVPKMGGGGTSKYPTIAAYKQGIIGHHQALVSLKNDIANAKANGDTKAVTTLTSHYYAIKGVQKKEQALKGDLPPTHPPPSPVKALIDEAHAVAAGKAIPPTVQTEVPALISTSYGKALEGTPDYDLVEKLHHGLVNKAPVLVHIDNSIKMANTTLAISKGNLKDIETHGAMFGDLGEARFAVKKAEARVEALNQLRAHAAKVEPGTLAKVSLPTTTGGITLDQQKLINKHLGHNDPHVMEVTELASHAFTGTLTIDGKAQAAANIDGRITTIEHMIASNRYTIANAEKQGKPAPKGTVAALKKNEAQVAAYNALKTKLSTLPASQPPVTVAPKLVLPTGSTPSWDKGKGTHPAGSVDDLIEKHGSLSHPHMNELEALTALHQAGSLSGVELMAGKDVLVTHIDQALNFHHQTMDKYRARLEEMSKPGADAGPFGASLQHTKNDMAFEEKRGLGLNALRAKAVAIGTGGAAVPLASEHTVNPQLAKSVKQWHKQYVTGQTNNSMYLSAMHGLGKEAGLEPDQLLAAVGIPKLTDGIHSHAYEANMKVKYAAQKLIDDRQTPTVHHVEGRGQFNEYHGGKANEYGRAAYAEWVAGLTAKETEEIRHYTDNGFQRTNKNLRIEAEGATTGPRIRALDSALAKGSTPEDLRVTRGFYHEKLYEMLRAGTPITGTTFHDNGYGSTSLDASKAFSSEIKFKINLPKGSPGAYVDQISANQGEREFLIPRNGNYVIRGYKKAPGGGWEVEVDYVGTGPASPTAIKSR